jgi:hypothetical protein
MWIFCITRDAKTAATVPKADSQSICGVLSFVT